MVWAASDLVEGALGVPERCRLGLSRFSTRVLPGLLVESTLPEFALTSEFREGRLFLTA